MRAEIGGMPLQAGEPRGLLADPASSEGGRDSVSPQALCRHTALRTPTPRPWPPGLRAAASPWLERPGVWTFTWQRQDPDVDGQTRGRGCLHGGIARSLVRAGPGPAAD